MANRNYIILEDKDGKEVLPVTDGNGVFVEGGTKKLESKLTEIDSKTTELNEQLDTMANDLILTNNDRINYDLRHSNSGLFKLYNKPNEFSDFPITILTDGYNFHTTFDVANFKHTGGKIYYVDPINGNNGNDGLTESTAVKRVYQAYTLCSDGDTIILLDGTYSRDTWFTTTVANNVINKSINIIAKNKGKVTVKSADDHTFTKVGETNVYSTNRGNVLTAIDIRGVANKITFELTRVTSLQECTDTENTWFQDGSTFYVHMFDNIAPNNNNLIVGLSTGVALINSTCSLQSINLYVEGINFIGGTVGTVHIRNSSTNLYPKFYAKDCQFKHGFSNPTASKDGISLLGCQGFFENCEVAFASKDGFNYHAYNGVVSNGIEINCKGYCNGIGWEDLTCNGSTMHDGGKIIRINGRYYNNQGANVADVSDGTVSLNLGCLAYDSLAKSKNGYDADFTTQQSGAKMYLDNCKAFGSYYSIRAVKGSTIELNNCSYSTIELL
jgi:hypothetical protein|uniref:Uncharacterized protein n=1 Tax=virus sp. ctE0n6 TaxID=2827985 RepID=A0A8S5RFA8_9VIRU|nr:MAG TPA: hypothetical protein [virus sp. ctE0n6]